MFTKENAQENRAVYEKAQELLEHHGIARHRREYGSLAEWEKTKKAIDVVIAELVPLFPAVPKGRIKTQVQEAARPKG